MEDNLKEDDSMENILMEDNLNERQPQWKTTSREDNINGRKPQWKATSMEDNINEKHPK